jgi:hypothetical protein
MQLMLTTQPLLNNLGPEDKNAKMVQFLDFITGVRSKVGASGWINYQIRY